MRVLIIAEAANPDWVSVPLIGWSLASAIGKKTSAHIVTHIRNRDAIVRTGLIEGRDFTALDSEALAAPLWRVSKFLRGTPGTGWTTASAFATLAYYYFEALVWKTFRRQLESRLFDVVHRVTPLSPATPSIIAQRCLRVGVPFVMGPLNGGVPWPREFGAERRREKEWLSYVRGAHRLLPGHRSGLRAAAAIIVGSMDTLSQIPSSLRGNCIYIPENGIDPGRFSHERSPNPNDKLRACFIGRLVHYKGPDVALEALAPLLRDGRATFDIVGDGPLRPALREMVDKLSVQQAVTLHGWVEHKRVQNIMSRADVLVFPSIREFGGGVVLEAMALGVVPIVVNYAGPGELVDDAVGYKVPLGARNAIVDQIRRLLQSLCDDRTRLEAKSAAGRARVIKHFTWSSKAEQILEVYSWVLKERSKPAFLELVCLPSESG